MYLPHLQKATHQKRKKSSRQTPIIGFQTDLKCTPTPTDTEQ